MMINILGQDLQQVLSVLDELDPDLAHLHLYGKKEARTNRKIGHLTLCAATAEDLIKEAQRTWRHL